MYVSVQFELHIFLYPVSSSQVPLSHAGASCRPMQPCINSSFLIKGTYFCTFWSKLKVVELLIHL